MLAETLQENAMREDGKTKELFEFQTAIYTPMSLCTVHSIS